MLWSQGLVSRKLWTGSRRTIRPYSFGQPGNPARRNASPVLRRRVSGAIWIGSSMVNAADAVWVERYPCRRLQCHACILQAGNAHEQQRRMIGPSRGLGTAEVMDFPRNRENASVLESAVLTPNTGWVTPSADLTHRFAVRWGCCLWRRLPWRGSASAIPPSPADAERLVCQSLRRPLAPLRGSRIHPPAAVK